MSLSFAVGTDLSKSNIDRLKRKFRLDEQTDVRFFKLVALHRQKNLRLIAALAMRRQLMKGGHHNITSALTAAKLPPFVAEMVSLDWW